MNLSTTSDKPVPSVSQGSARSLLLTVLGEFVMPTGESVWTSSLLTALGDLGIEPQTARQAIARAAATDLIRSERHGRETRWTLTDEGIAYLHEGERRVYALADPAPWNGTWLVAFLTIPQSQRVVRKKVYAALQRRGFGNPTPGVWVSPHADRIADLARQLDKYALTDSTLTFSGAALATGLSDSELVARSWAIEAISEHYEALLQRFRDHVVETHDSPLQSQVRLVNAWQHLPLIDPQLPVELLPNWIGREATRVFTRLRASGLPAARTEWEAITGGNRA